MTDAAYSPSPDVLAAFEAWCHAAKAFYFAAPCPDDLMNSLCKLEGDAAFKLAAAPAQNPHDVVLKLLPLALFGNEPDCGGLPFLPKAYEGPEVNRFETEFWQALITDLPIVSPLIRDMMATPASAYNIDLAARAERQQVAA